MRYNNYHKHTHYSNIRTIDSIAKPIDYIKRAKELGHNSYFTTEHGFQGNIFEANTLCEEYGIRCIYGVEAYYVDDMCDKTHRTNYHIILIAMTNQGRKQINRIMSKANQEGFYYKPRIDLNCLLSLNPNDVIVTTACVASRLFKPTIKRKLESVNHNEEFVEYEDSDSWLNDFFIPVYDHFGNSLFLEVQDHNTGVQSDYNRKIIELSNKYSVPLIHANDSHYIYPSDSKYRDLFLKAKGFYYEDENGFVLDYPDSETIISRYNKQGVLNDSQIQEALNNTLIFDNAETIRLNKEFKIPKIKPDIIKEELQNSKINTDNDNKVLKEIIKRAWLKEKNNINDKRIPEYEKAIYYETNIVEKCGMAAYFILDHIIVKRAIEKYNAILTRSGRGSAVSFYINHLLGLTEIDRLKAPITLYPTRFMSAERILQSKSLPD